MEGLSETAKLALRYVNFFAVFARWQHYIRRTSPISGNAKESEDPVLDPDADPDHHQNLTTSNLGQD